MHGVALKKCQFSAIACSVPLLYNRCVPQAFLHFQHEPGKCLHTPHAKDMRRLEMEVNPAIEGCMFLQKAKKTAAAKAPASDLAAAAATLVAMPEGSAAQEGTPAKPKTAQCARPKASDLDIAQVEAKVKQMFASGEQSKLSVPEIKAFLKAHYQLLTGKKADLLERVSNVLSGTGI